MKRHANPLRAGFTLIEIMVATVISLILVLGVVQIATYAIRAYNSAMSVVSATAVSRQVLDTLESDIQSSLVKSDGNIWMECLNPKDDDRSPDSPPSPTNSNFDTGACNSLILFSTPTDRDVFKAGVPRTNPDAIYKGEVCAVRYRLNNVNPLPDALNSDKNTDRAYTLNRVVVNPEDTFNKVLKVSTDTTRADTTLPKILGSITVDEGTPASRAIKKDSAADIFGMNVVGMTPVFIFKRTDPTKSPSTWYFYAVPDSPVNRATYTATFFSEGFGGATSPAFQPVFFNNLKISGGKFADSTAKPTQDAPANQYTPGSWNQGTLTAVLISITVVDDVGADEIRAAQTRKGSGQIDPDEWNRIMSEHSHSFTRRINIPGN